ncbi:hypothetical protein BKA83DRAFT_4127198 [Pisolithus microcarpus]|nr:hypothetical protein BKA83DRAFT_4127198 [Pisolithus microcarpus]
MSKLDGGEGMGINMWMEKGRGGLTLQEGPGGWLLLLEELDGSSGETGRAREWGGLTQQSLKWWLFQEGCCRLQVGEGLLGGEMAWGSTSSLSVIKNAPQHYPTLITLSPAIQTIIKNSVKAAIAPNIGANYTHWDKTYMEVDPVPPQLKRQEGKNPLIQKAKVYSILTWLLTKAQKMIDKISKITKESNYLKTRVQVKSEVAEQYDVDGRCELEQQCVQAL